MKQILSFLKKESVLCISMLLAIISICIVPSSGKYLQYIDYRTLSLLLCLMLVMSGFRSLGLFKKLGESLLVKCHTTKQVSFVLVFLCFFSSMIITNDVALLTFVPFTIEILALSDEHRLAIPIIVLQTIAANLGSMMTPLGNPQNLYLYSLSGMDLPTFVIIMFPYTLLSFIGIALICFLLPKRELHIKKENKENSTVHNKGLFILYNILFILCLLCVFRLLSYLIVLPIILLSILLWDRTDIRKADYALLLTFIFLFIFIGNLSNIAYFQKILGKIVQGNELLTGILASQVISNVPAAILLSGFTDHYRDLLISVNIGGLGTLIASMASLISLKQFLSVYPDKKAKYIFVFTVLNLLFLFILYVVASFYQITPLTESFAVSSLITFIPLI